MDKAFLFNPTITSVQIEDAINIRLWKANALLTCLMSSAEFLENKCTANVDTIHNALWAINDFLEEISTLWHHFKSNNTYLAENEKH